MKTIKYELRLCFKHRLVIIECDHFISYGNGGVINSYGLDCVVLIVMIGITCVLLLVVCCLLNKNKKRQLSAT